MSCIFFFFWSRYINIVARLTDRPSKMTPQLSNKIKRKVLNLFSILAFIYTTGGRGGVIKTHKLHFKTLDFTFLNTLL